MSEYLDKLINDFSLKTLKLVDRTTRFLVAGIIPNRKASSVNKMSWLAYAIPSIS